MLNNIREPEERRLMILEGIDHDLNSLEIAVKLGVDRWIVRRDLRTMRYNRDPELKQAYLDQENRTLTNKQSLTNVRDEGFRLMTGMTFQEKNFENMVSYYRPELIKIQESSDEEAAIMGLSRSVQRTLARNEIISGLRYRHRISSKARGFLPQKEQ